MRTIIILGLLVLLGIILSRPSVAQNPNFPAGMGLYPAGGRYIVIQVDANGVVQTTT